MLIAARIAERRDEIALLGSQKGAAARQALADESAAYPARLACLDRPRSARIAPVLTMLANGTYVRFRGYKSGLKDLLVP